MRVLCANNFNGTSESQLSGDGEETIAAVYLRQGDLLEVVFTALRRLYDGRGRSKDKNFSLLH